MGGRRRNDENLLREYEGFRQKFFARLVPEKDCLVWVGTRYRSGHGSVGFLNRLYRTHRVAWVLAYGTIPGGVMVCHRCDNPPCCKPEHLFLGSALDNARDAKTKGRMVVGLRNPNRPRGEASGRAKLTTEQIRAIRAEKTAGASLGELSGKYGVSKANLSSIVRRQTWGHIA